MINAASAQARANQIRAFKAEMAELAENNVCHLSPEQAQAVEQYHASVLASSRARFDVDTGARSHHLGIGIQVVSFLGAWALAASVFFFFMQFWGRMPMGLQVSVLIGSSLASLVLTAWIAGRDGPGRYFAKIAALISFACVVINVSLLGTLYNLPASPAALMVFAVYGALLAYALRVRLLLGVAILSLFSFIGAQSATYSGMYWLSVGERPEHFILPTALLFWLPSVWSQANFNGFACIYRVLSLIGLSVVVLVLSNWGAGSYIPWERDWVEGFYQVMGFAISAGAIWLGVRNGWPEVLATANVFFFLYMYTKFFDWWWDWLPKSVFFLLLGLTALLALFIFNRLRRYAQGEGL
ncbi:DUF2157 domain-containing protein [Gilvimarinus sp. SDUM040013]|uniref:DUF2157 domain-containing protein n=1 Tax=Gilvimarinus gilvus TaxID=3058038 RepID=A0ABU4RYV8_9GAMM|nr:DUF2157 domain-containing protein [Gilvimarinus sp. SDUM040013]MDO3387836.1 DUF2157 domain-containing protein [Gilvimarinus sp. SDUM040013]MDX6848793.1 DUF2157 domain-containing protein [Gilvimarinus sp. SDUM040013]